MNTFLKALCAGLATVVLASPAAVAGLSIEMTNTITITTTSAVVRLKVVTNDATSAQAWLYWGLTNNGNNATWPNTNAVGAVITGSVYTVSLSGLTAGTTYWATAYATNGATNAWATWQTNFNTLATYSPTSIVVSTYPSGILRSPTNFFTANGISTNSSGDALATSNYIQTVALAGTNFTIAGDLAGSNYVQTAALAGTNHTISATNALDIALRAIIAAGSTITGTVAAASWSANAASATSLVGIVTANITTNNASTIDSGTLADARIASTIARDSEVAIATNAAIDDATQRVAAAGYLLPASTSTLASVVYVDTATNTLDVALRLLISAGGISGGTATDIVHNVVDGPFLVTSNAIDTATNAVYILSTNAAYTAAKLLTNGLATVALLNTATNAAIDDATQRVAAAGYLLPASTSTLATAASVVSATQTIAGASVSGAVPSATWAAVAASSTNATSAGYASSAGSATSATSADYAGYLVQDVGAGWWGMISPFGGVYLDNQEGGYVYYIDFLTRRLQGDWTNTGHFAVSSNATVNGTLTVLGGGNVLTNGGSGLSLTGVNTNSASTLDSGTVPLARLSGITTNEMAAAEKIRIDQAVTNGQSGVTLTGTLTPTNELTVTNSLQLGGVAASGYATNAGAAGGGYYAMSNGVWTSFAPGTGTGGGNQTPLTNHVDAAGYSITNLLGLVSTAAVGQVAFRMPFGTYMEWSDGTSTNYVRVTAISAGVVHWLSASNSASVVTNIMQVNP